MKKIKLAVIGGGAQAEGVYLPLLAVHPVFELTALVEYDKSRLRVLQERFNIPIGCSTLQELSTECDAAIVAVPNYLHYDVTRACLNSNIHTLVEKPMAISVNECESMINIAEQTDTRLMVAMVRRYYENILKIKQLIDGESLGKLKHIQVEEGYVFNWPVTSDSLINKMKSGGGVLIDIGVHVLDTLYFWLGKPISFEYFDDSAGNIEAECRLHLSWASGNTASVLLSRLRNLSNRICLNFEQGTMRTDTRSSVQVEIDLNEGLKIEGQFVIDGTDQRDKLMAFKMQLNDFADLISTGREPMTSLSDARDVINFICGCYKNKKPLSIYYQHF